MKRRIFLGTLVAAATGLLIPHHGRISNTTTAAAREQTVPEQAYPPLFEPYGRIVFQIRPEAPHQLYIVGQIHATPLTNRIDPETIETQTEIYRIGQRLVKDLDLVLLEGETANMVHTDHNDNRRMIRDDFQRHNFLNDIVTGKMLPKLMRTNVAKEKIPAEQGGYWLAVAYDLDIQGAEDEKLHKLALEYVKLKVRTTRVAFDAMEVSDVEYITDNAFNHINQLRTVYILVNTPKVIEREYAAQRITRKNALVIIGANHIADCVQFVKDDHVRSTPPPESNAPPLNQPLGYAQAGYGVTVIMPRTIEHLKP